MDNMNTAPAPMAAPPQPAAPQAFPADKKVEAATASRPPERARAAAAPSVAEHDQVRQRSEETQSFAPSGAGVAALAKSSARQDAATAKAVDIDASILRIRKLHDEGRLADAAKELIALRAAVFDADLRLPPELRAWAATVKP